MFNQFLLRSGTTLEMGYAGKTPKGAVLEEAVSGLLPLVYAHVFASFVPDGARNYSNKINGLNSVRNGQFGRRQVLPGPGCRRGMIGAFGADHQGEEGGGDRDEAGDHK